MPHLNGHGGSCCGINHILSFGNYPAKEYLKSLDHAIASRMPVRQKGLLEVVLTDAQIRGESKEGLTWHEALLERGFVRVARFYNSGNSTCNVYHLIHGQDNLIGERYDPVLSIEKKKKEPPKKKPEVQSPFSKQESEPPRPARQGRAAPAINATPRAVRVAAERGVSLVGVRGTGLGGTIMVRDVPRA